MKKTILLLGITLLAHFPVFSQLYVSTNHRMDFSWDDMAEEWSFESEDVEALTFFEFNQELTLMKHTTASITSAYLIKASEYDDENGNDQYIFDIVSDVGNKYLMVLDFANDNVRFVYSDGSHMVKHMIKSTWTEE